MKGSNGIRYGVAIGLATVALLAAPDRACPRALADPVLSVRDGGTANGNQLWLVEVAPDPSLFGDTPEGLGGSLAVELDFRITESEIVSVTANDADWPYENSGFNPFAGAISRGVALDTTTAFISLGSDLFTTGDAVEVATIETLGAGLGMLSWGGNMATPPGGNAYDTARIAQDGMNFDGYQGMLAVSISIPGDFNSSGLVEQGDLDLVLGNWGSDTVPGTWTNDPPVGIVDQAELDKVLGNWGRNMPGLAAAVPEPTAWMLLCCGLAPLAVRYSRCVTTRQRSPR